MFTWICPKCGSEVPPSENECPTCRARATAPAAMVSTETPVAPVITPPPPPPSYAPPPVEMAKPRSSLSPGLVMLCSAVGLVVLLAMLYTFVLPKGGTTATAAKTELQNPAAQGPSATPAHPLAKYIQITGIRIMPGGTGQAKVGYVVVNHSPADLPALKAQLTLTGGGSPIFDVPVEIPSIGPFESKDLTASVRTQLKPYEMPDWQTLTPNLRIISEQ
jgi:hypothetical protein